MANSLVEQVNGNIEQIRRYCYYNSMRNKVV